MGCPASRRRRGQRQRPARSRTGFWARRATSGPSRRGRGGRYQRSAQMIEFTLTRTTSAPIEAVFDRLTDHANYKNVSPLRISELVRLGEPEPNGVGAIRRMGLVGPTQTEEVTVFERPTRFDYQLRSGLPVRDHTGTVELAKTGAGTHITYS